MKLPLIIAHGQEIFAFIFFVSIGALVTSVIGLLAGLLKQKAAVSRFGATCAILGIIGGGLLVWWHGWSEFMGLLSVAMLSPLPIALLALVFSLRRKEQRPNKAPEPTPGSVTPRAKE